MMATVLFAACNRQNQEEPKVEGHYNYEHAFEYDYQGNHFDVHETGTMDFYSDGSALDSAQQVYNTTLEGGETATIVFSYISPSRWSLAGDTFTFAGIKDKFSMEMEEIKSEGGCDLISTAQLSDDIIKLVGGSIDYEYKFHLDSLTADKLQWSFTYRDGHSDTWVFRKEKRE